MTNTHFSSSATIILCNGAIASRSKGCSLAIGAEAIAIAGNRVIAVGSNDDILHLQGPDTETIDLQGRLIVPGFIDSHIHFYEWSLKLQDLQLDDIGSLKELLARVSHRAKIMPAGQWLMGQGWNETDWAIPRMPSRANLDSAAPDNPVLLWRCDLHLAVANSRALQLAGIDDATLDPPEGRIERDANGTPNGVLRELAINLVRNAVAPPDAGRIEQAFGAGSRELHKLGITGIHDIRLMHDSDGAKALRGFQELDRNNQLDLRSWVTLPGHQLDDIIGLGLQSGFGNDRLRLGHVKYFSDGGMGARTAWMLEPFLDAGKGMPLMDMGELARDIDRADSHGLAVMVHAVGDRANRELINIFAALENRRKSENRTKPYKGPYYPHRIEHVQMIRPDDLKRLKKLNLALNVTPSNMILDINLIDRILAERGQWTYPFRQLLDSGAPVMFSSDCPVCSPAPLPAIHAAVTRQRRDATPAGGWYPGARIDAGEALAAFTSTPAHVHKAYDIGTIEPGNKADLAILSDNILTGAPETIANTTVDMTLFDGRIVHRLL